MLMTVGLGLIVVGMVGQLYRRTPLSLKAAVWIGVVGLMFVWVVSH